LQISYSIPVENGDYDVVLHFAEPDDLTVAEKRILTVLIEDTRLVRNLIIADEVGLKAAYTMDAIVTVNDGWLNIIVKKDKKNGGEQHAVLHAIEAHPLFTPTELLERLPSKNSGLYTTPLVGAAGIALPDGRVSPRWSIGSAPFAIQAPSHQFLSLFHEQAVLWSAAAKYSYSSQYGKGNTLYTVVDPTTGTATDQIANTEHGK
jgi:hypothetical protein